MILTLSVNKQKVYLNENNIAFAVVVEGKNEETNKIEQFTRIYLKELVKTDDFIPWIDVIEDVEEIESLTKKNKNKK